MGAVLLDGKATSAALRAEIGGEVARLGELGIRPGLATLLVGDDPGSASYVRMKHKACQEVGIHSVQAELPATAGQAEVEDAIEALNEDEAVSGFIVQLPLPGRLDEEDALCRIDPAKDADGLHPENLGRLVLQKPAMLPCTPAGICELLARYEVPVEGSDVVILGRGVTVGRPLGLLLSMKWQRGNATVTVCHTRTRDVQEHARRADILVAAFGRAGAVDAAWVKPGAAVVDVGITRTASGLAGDVNRASVEPVAGWLAPMPGGVGPMTVAMLLSNTVEAACRRARIDRSSL